MEISWTITSKVKECMCGQMEESTRGSGRTTRCTEQVNSSGQMVDCMKVSIRMTRRKDRDCSPGLMEGSIEVAGRMESRTVKAHTLVRKEQRRRVFGKLERGRSG